MLSLDYVAGIIDGEGCINFHFIREKSLYCRLTVEMTNKKLIELLHSQFGGIFYNRIRGTKNKRTYLWRVYGNDAIKILLKVYPYLVVKEPQAKLIMQFYSLDINDDKEINEYFRSQMKVLNKRGIDEK